GYGHGAEWWKEFISTLRMFGYDYVLSIEHEDTLLCLFELGCCQHAAGNSDRARALLEQASDSLRTRLPVANYQRTEAAWAHYQSLVETNDPGAEGLFRDELAWLLEPDAEPEAWVQREIRQALMTASEVPPTESL
ncbi:MAG: hypothetical protein ABI743_05390, partial [bacterium]